MFLHFTGGELYATAHPEDPDSVLVEAKDWQTLEVMKDSIELAGAAEGEGDELVILERVEGWFCKISRATFCLFLFFEVMHYMEAVDDFAEVPGAESLVEDSGWKGVS